MTDKSATAFRTIGEVSDEIGVPQHVLRYWETRFPQLKPVTRAGNRRYYRPEDVALVRRIHGLLNAEGYTVKGVQKLLGAKSGDEIPAAPVAALPIGELKAIRAALAEALAAA
ncbi:MerR family transcriptional regulator [Sphingomonas sp. CGMCC 1.13654]|uniref:MerR family transcriptional regulator n=1 Tax=Sphingomonas chungangi TaxID=2683589 RepID=A0A838L7B7_9SPHN|nr:MerR family transcriptional regulator [Sphingomonas chungangi]MBA2934036.1 MerR family transcriptional regulator [Sphingomonas chungangi]MVW57782.1 MerR family transcriptional regulator [Sphingomonas chungangi]